MNWIQRLILGKHFIEQIKAQTYTPGVRYPVQNGRIVVPADNKKSYLDNGYNVNDIVYSVLQMVLDKVRLPDWDLFKIADETSLKEANRMFRMEMKSENPNPFKLKKARELKDEALEPIVNYNLQQGKLNDLLEYPNDYCTFEDLITDACGYKMLTGDAYLFGEILKAGANQGLPNTIWNLPSQYMNISCSDSFPVIPLEYKIFIWNQTFGTEQILHDKYWNPNWNINGEQLYGFAPLRAFLKNTTRNNAAKDASSSKFQNGGLEEIVYFDDDKVQLDPKFAQEQMSALKIKLAEEYSGPLQQGKKAFTGYKVGVAPMGLSPVDLGIIDSEKWDAVMFCNGYGVPPELLGLVNKTYNTGKEAEKALTTRSAMPLLTSMRNAFNRKIQTDWGFKGQNIYADFDTSCFSELEPDIRQTMQWISQMTAITPNEERFAVGLDALPDPMYDEPWIAQGRVPASDFNPNAVDQILNNGNGNGANSANGADNGQADTTNGNGALSGNGSGKSGMPNGNHVSKAHANGVSTKAH